MGFTVEFLELEKKFQCIPMCGGVPTGFCGMTVDLDTHPKTTLKAV